MALDEIQIPTEGALARTSIPSDVEAVIRDCEERYDEFQRRRPDEAVIAFVQSDLHTLYRTLTWLRDFGPVPGRCFLEWGSGVGAVAMLGAMLGFDAYGIEVERELVDDSRMLAMRHGVEIEFACGSFIPNDADYAPQHLDEFAWLDTSTPDAYEDLELDIDDFDLIFAYPWPGEQDVMFGLFDMWAARGACLLTNHGLEGLRLHRKR